MKRSTAIILTVVSSLLCGLPSLFLLCTGGLAIIGAQSPEVMAQNPGSSGDVMTGSVMFICLGGVLLLIPILVGFFSFRMSKTEESAGNDMMPPAV